MRFFFGIWILGQTDCLAVTYNEQEIPDLPTKPDGYDFNTFLFRSSSSGTYYLFYVQKSSYFYFTDNESNISSWGTSGASVMIYWRNTRVARYRLVSGSTSWVLNNYSYSNGFSTFSFSSPVIELIYSTDNLSYGSNMSFWGEGNDQYLSTFSPPVGTIENYYKSYVGLYHGINIVPGVEPEIDRLDLFKLKLTDQNFRDNNQHTFTLYTDENDRYYDELMKYYNTRQ